MSIFVGNLPFRAEREDVLQLFAPFGEVLNCSLPLERDTGRGKQLYNIFTLCAERQIANKNTHFKLNKENLPYKKTTMSSLITLLYYSTSKHTLVVEK